MIAELFDRTADNSRTSKIKKLLNFEELAFHTINTLSQSSEKKVQHEHELTNFDGFLLRNKMDGEPTDRQQGQGKGKARKAANMACSYILL